MLQLCSAFEKPPNFAVLPWAAALAVDASTAKSVEFIDRFRELAMSNEFRLELPDRDELCLRRRQGGAEISVSCELSGASARREQQERCRRALESSNKPAGTGKISQTISTRQSIRLDSPDVLGLQAFGPFYDIELDRLAFLKRTKSLALDGRMMHEHVFAVSAAKEAESLCIVKPFYCSLFHDYSFVA
jgi:hypothetical protein